MTAHSEINELSPADRAWIADLVRQTRHQQFVTLTPQAEIRRCLQTGAPVTCTATYQVDGLPQTFPLPLERTTDGGLSFAVADWPATLRPLSVALLHPLDFLEAQQLPAKSRTFGPLLQRAPDHAENQALPQTRVPSLTELGATSTPRSTELAAASRVDGSYTPWTIDWDREETIRITYQGDEAEAAPYVHVGVVIGSRVKPSLQRVLQLSAIPGHPGDFRGTLNYSWPKTKGGEKIEDSVTIELRTATAADLAAFEPHGASGLSAVNALLASQQDAARALRRVGERVATQPMPACADQPLTTVVFTGSRQEEGTGVGTVPFDQGSAPVRTPNDVNQSMFAFRALFATQPECAKERFEDAVLAVQARLRRRLCCLTGDGDAADDLLQNVLFDVYKFFPATTSDDPEYPIRYFSIVAGRKAQRWYTKRKAISLETPEALPSHELTKLSSLALQELREMDDSFFPDLNDIEQRYWLLATLELSDGELADELDLTIDQVRTLRTRLFRKLRVLRALKFLGNRLSAEERAYLRCRELVLPDQKGTLRSDGRPTGLHSGQRASFLETSLSITAAVREDLEIDAGSKLDIALGLENLASMQLVDEKDRVFLLNWCLDPYALKHQQDQYLHVDLQRFSHQLHAAILLERDVVSAESLLDAGRKFVEWICLRGRSIAELLVQLEKPAEGDDPSGKKPKRISRFQKDFGGDLGRLRAHVRTIWEGTATLVPPMWRAWRWDGVDVEMTREQA